MKKWGFQARVFIYFTIVFIIILTIFFTYLYVNLKETLYQTEKAALAPITQKLSDQVDSLYEKIDSAVLSFTTNQENLNAMVELNYTNSQNQELLVNKSTLTKNIASIYNVISDLYKITIFVPDHNIFFSYIREDTGIHSIPSRYTNNNNQFADDYLKFAGLPPHWDDWSTDPELVISVVRGFRTPYDTNFGMMEISLRYRELEELVSMQNTESLRNVYIFDDSGQLVFPHISKVGEKSEEILLLYNEFQKQKETAKVNDHSFLYSTYTSDYTNWTTIIAVDQAALVENLQQNKKLLIAIGAVILVVIMILYYIIIRKLLKPLKQLTLSVRKVNIDHLSISEVGKPQNQYNEFVMLNYSFERMIQRLKQSIQTEYEARIRESEVQYAALQAQMNPHFMYNTLHVIAANCENKDSTTASEMCYQLADMMRYSADIGQGNCKLQDEIKHVTSYLELMKLHYDDSLSYEIQIPESMQNLIVPKLTLEPFVENAINHGFDKILPPWFVSIKGNYSDDLHWKITIEDNGAGIEKDILYEMNVQLEKYRQNSANGELLKTLKISGMGLLNTYARLMTHFKQSQSFYFFVENKVDQGVRITFGLNREETDNDTHHGSGR